MPVFQSTGRAVITATICGVFLAACDETTTGAGGGGYATPSAGGASGDEIFTRDEKGCLYQRIEGNLLPIVNSSGRQMCDTFS